MKKVKRKSISPKILAAENGAVTQFLFDRAVPAKGTKLPLQEFFDKYEAWRRINKLKPTVLTIDGFGRLFPKDYQRKSAYWAPVGHALKCVFGIVVR